MSKTCSETVLAIIPATEPDHRLLVVLCHRAGKRSRIQLRQQSWGEGIGWFTQSSVEVEPGQLAELRGALGSGSSPSRRRAPWRSLQVRSGTFRWAPRIVQADSA